MPVPTIKDVLDYYYEIPPWRRGRQMRWVLSTETVEAIAAACGLPSAPLPPGIDDSEWVLGNPMLLGCPVRIDDSVDGLSHEFVEGVPIWIHRDKAAYTTSL